MPNDDLFAQLSTLLEEMPVVPKNLVHRIYKRREVAPIKGTKSDVVRGVREALTRDFFDNINGALGDSCFFDYVIDDFRMVNAKVLRGLSILTRLFSPNSQHGDIMYGTIVYRVESNCYLFWLDWE